MYLPEIKKGQTYLVEVSENTSITYEVADISVSNVCKVTKEYITVVTFKSDCGSVFQTKADEVVKSGWFKLIGVDFGKDKDKKVDPHSFDPLDCWKKNSRTPIKWKSETTRFEAEPELQEKLLHGDWLEKAKDIEVKGEIYACDKNGLIALKTFVDSILK